MPAQLHGFAGGEGCGCRLCFRDQLDAHIRGSIGNLSLNGYLVLKAQWEVSAAALIARAHDLGLISDNRRKSLMVQVSYTGWRKAEPVNVAAETPILLRQMVNKTFGSNPYMKASHSLHLECRYSS